MTKIELYIAENEKKRMIVYHRNLGGNYIRKYKYYSSNKENRDIIIEGMKVYKKYVQYLIDEGYSNYEVHRKVWLEDPFQKFYDYNTRK